MALTKIELTKTISEEIGFTKKEGLTVVDSLFEIMTDPLGKGNDVMISGFGKWTVKSKRVRNGRNRQTGETIKIDARKVVTFKGSYEMRKGL